MEIELAIDGDMHPEKALSSSSSSETVGGGAAYLAWEDLTVFLPNFGNGSTRRLLNGLHGYAQPGRILVIMGPSGSGKSTLLDSLAGRLSGNVVMTGNVILNGKKTKLNYGGAAYVTQEDVLLGTLTVKESISYSAHLRLPADLTKNEVNGIVEETIIEMGLQDCADHIIGNWHLRGISGGEKKRLSIALEILTRPRLLFLDEPTSGLDSASSFFVIQALRNVARDGRTIITSIHQPSSEVFALFDDLSLLSAGEMIYFGEANLAAEFFAEAGFPCPSKRNPSDHFLQCINSDFDHVKSVLRGSRRMCSIQKSSSPFMGLATSEIKTRLIEKYRASHYAVRARSRIREIKTTKGLIYERKRESQAGWFKQLITLTKRSSVNMSRDIGYYWLRIVVYIVVAVCVGTVFFNIGTDYNSILARGACGGFISGFMTFMSIGGFPSFIEEMKIFKKERLNGHYGVVVYIISNFISSFPFLVVLSFTSSTIIYYMVRYRPGFFHYVYTCLDLFISISVVESSMMVVASLVPNFLMGVLIGSGFIGIMMMTAGFFRPIPDLPKAFWQYPIAYMNYMAWALQGAYKNDMIGLEFDAEKPGEPKLKGEVIINTMLGISLEHSKWWDLTAVVMILLCYRLIFYTVLKLKERALPMFRTLYVDRTLQHLSKRPSFRLTPPFPSKRHHSMHPLASQDGFNSPID